MKILIITLVAFFIFFFVITDAFGIGDDDNPHEGGIHP